MRLYQLKDGTTLDLEDISYVSSHQNLIDSLTYTITFKHGGSILVYENKENAVYTHPREELVNAWLADKTEKEDKKDLTETNLNEKIENIKKGINLVKKIKFWL